MLIFWNSRSTFQCNITLSESSLLNRWKNVNVLKSLKMLDIKNCVKSNNFHQLLVIELPTIFQMTVSALHSYHNYLLQLSPNYSHLVFSSAAAPASCHLVNWIFFVPSYIFCTLTSIYLFRTLTAHIFFFVPSQLIYFFHTLTCELCTAHIFFAPLLRYIFFVPSQLINLFRTFTAHPISVQSGL